VVGGLVGRRGLLLGSLFVEGEHGGCLLESSSEQCSQNLSTLFPLSTSYRSTHSPHPPAPTQHPTPTAPQQRHHHRTEQLTPGSHMSEAAVNKQLNDKERVAAALENAALLGMVDRCVASADGDKERGKAQV